MQRKAMQAVILVITVMIVLLPTRLVSAFETEQRPILYPNAHYEIMGPEAVAMDVEDCWNLARQAGARENNAEQLSEDAAGDAAALAVAGAAAAAALGRDPHRAAVAGAAAGGAASWAAGMIQQKNPPPVFRGIVERCLFEKGYEVAGWE